jgi:hypothetical protein
MKYSPGLIISLAVNVILIIGIITFIVLANYTEAFDYIMQIKSVPTTCKYNKINEPERYETITYKEYCDLWKE